MMDLDISPLLTPALTEESRGQIVIALTAWFASRRKAPVHDLEFRTQAFQNRIIKLAQVLEVTHTEAGFVIDPGVELQTYTALTRGALWFDGDAEQVHALIVAAALEGAL